MVLACDADVNYTRGVHGPGMCCGSESPNESRALSPTHSGQHREISKFKS